MWVFYLGTKYHTLWIEEVIRNFAKFCTILYETCRIDEKAHTSISYSLKPSPKFFVPALPRYCVAYMYLYLIDSIFRAYPINTPCQLMCYLEFQFCILMFSLQIRFCISSFKFLLVMFVGPFKRSQHLTNIRSTKVATIADKSWTEWSNGSNGIQHFQEQGKCWIDVEWKFKRIYILFTTLSTSLWKERITPKNMKHG